jgi:regulatory factor X
MDMKPAKSRSRSNTAASIKSRQRPLSRASTTSIHSAATQPRIEQQQQQQQHDVPQEYPKQWFDPNALAQQRFGDISHQMTPEDMVMHSASQLQNPRGYDLDPSIPVGQSHGLVYSHDHRYKTDIGRHSVPADGYSMGFNEGESQLIEGRSDEQDEVDSLAGASGPAKKASKSSAANELEMRQLFQTNKHRTLPEVASELHGNERGPQSERQRQVFAMLWYVSLLAIIHQKIDNN